jgi:hypothetical protein
MIKKRFLKVECELNGPTKKHRPAIWECMLGTVFAMNDKGEIKYFDYRYDEARAFAGVDEPGRNPRLAKYGEWNHRNMEEDVAPRKGHFVLWVLRKEA